MARERCTGTDSAVCESFRNLLALLDSIPKSVCSRPCQALYSLEPPGLLMESTVKVKTEKQLLDFQSRDFGDSSLIARMCEYGLHSDFRF